MSGLLKQHVRVVIFAHVLKTRHNLIRIHKHFSLRLTPESCQTGEIWINVNWYLMHEESYSTVHD